MKVVILCGGKGTRSYPYTEFFPKPMIPVCGRPILVHIMQLYAKYGFKKFVLAAGHRQAILHDYFEGRFKDWQVEVLDTGLDADTGERIRRCRDYVGDRFFATYGDGVGNIRIDELLKFHTATGGLASVTTVPLPSQYGTIVSDGSGCVSEVREKPVLLDHWINAGFFVFEKAAFDSWKGHNLEKEVLPELAHRGFLYNYKHDGFWKSMDTSKDQQDLEALFQDGIPPWMSENTNSPMNRSNDGMKTI